MVLLLGGCDKPKIIIASNPRPETQIMHPAIKYQTCDCFIIFWVSKRRMHFSRVATHAWILLFIFFWGVSQRTLYFPEYGGGSSYFFPEVEGGNNNALLLLREEKWVFCGNLNGNPGLLFLGLHGERMCGRCDTCSKFGARLHHSPQCTQNHGVLTQPWSLLTWHHPHWIRGREWIMGACPNGKLCGKRGEKGWGRMGSGNLIPLLIDERSGGDEIPSRIFCHTSTAARFIHQCQKNCFDIDSSSGFLLGNTKVCWKVVMYLLPSFTVRKEERPWNRLAGNLQSQNSISWKKGEKKGNYKFGAHAFAIFSDLPLFAPCKIAILRLRTTQNSQKPSSFLLRILTGQCAQAERTNPLPFLPKTVPSTLVCRYKKKRKKKSRTKEEKGKEKAKDFTRAEYIRKGRKEVPPWLPINLFVRRLPIFSSSSSSS